MYTSLTINNFLSTANSSYLFEIGDDSGETDGDETLNDSGGNEDSYGWKMNQLRDVRISKMHSRSQNNTTTTKGKEKVIMLW